MSLHNDQLRQALRAYATDISDTCAPPQASLIWLRAERRRRRMAIERAERPLRIMQAVGLVCAVFAVVWMIYKAGSFHQLPAISGTGLLLAVACTFLVLTGCWTMLLASRRPSS
jgi:hypothetical protein